VVAQLGRSAPSRAAAAILTAVGMTEWVAADRPAYVALAVERSRDRARLAALKDSLRPALSRMPAGDADAYAAAAGRAFRSVWTAWCARTLGAG
jgi:predicted O-linked N-acetylglucosamine transferase (SPINDLY family)